MKNIRSKVKQEWQNFHSQYGRLPTTEEMKKRADLTDSRTIYYHLGPVRELRKQLGYGDVDFGRGELRSAISSKVTHRSINDEKELYGWLCEEFDKRDVVTQPYYKYPESQRRADYGVYTRVMDLVLVDIFYAQDVNSVRGSLNSKLRVLPDGVEGQVVYVCTNPNIGQDTINGLILRKESDCKGVMGMTMEYFKNWIVTLL